MYKGRRCGEVTAGAFLKVGRDFQSNAKQADNVTKANHPLDAPDFDLEAWGASDLTAMCGCLVDYA